MKAFLEEYGLVVVVAIIALIVIAFATPLGNYIVDAIKATVEHLFTESNVSGTTIPGWGA